MRPKYEYGDKSQRRDQISDDKNKIRKKKQDTLRAIRTYKNELSDNGYLWFDTIYKTILYYY